MGLVLAFGMAGRRRRVGGVGRVGSWRSWRPCREESPEIVEEVPQNVELSLSAAFQRILQPSLANGWTLLGDLLTCGLAAPLLAIFYLRVGVLHPDWFTAIADAEKDFIFPEFAHGVIFSLCWCYGGLAIGAFEADAVNPQNLLQTIQRTIYSGAVTAWLASVVRSFLTLSGNLEAAYAFCGYSAPLSHAMPSYPDFFIDLLFEVFLLVAWRFTAAVVLAKSPVPERDDTEVDGRLLFGDLLAAGFITPTLVIEVFFKTQTYTPIWTVFWDVSDYGVWKPILAHGSILAVCWLVGAFAAGAYSKDALAPIDLPLILKRLWTAGIIATVLLGAFNFLSGNLVESQGFLTAYSADVTMQKQFFDFTTDVVFAAVCLNNMAAILCGIHLVHRTYISVYTRQ